MEFQLERAKESAIDTGAAVVGAVVGLTVSNKVTQLITEKSPSSTLARHVPAAILVGVLAAQAFGVVPPSEVVDSALQGVAVVTAMQAVREYTGANTPAGLASTTGIAALVNQYVPAFSHEGTTAGQSAAQLDATAALQGLGLIDYRDPGQAALLAGREQQLMPPGRPQLAPNNLGRVPAPRAQVVG